MGLSGLTQSLEELQKDFGRDLAYLDHESKVSPHTYFKEDVEAVSTSRSFDRWCLLLGCKSNPGSAIRTNNRLTAKKQPTFIRFDFVAELLKRLRRIFYLTEIPYLVPAAISNRYQNRLFVYIQPDMFTVNIVNDVTPKLWR